VPSQRSEATTVSCNQEPRLQSDSGSKLSPRSRNRASSSGETGFKDYDRYRASGVPEAPRSPRRGFEIDEDDLEMATLGSEVANMQKELDEKRAQRDQALHKQHVEAEAKMQARLEADSDRLAALEDSTVKESIQALGLARLTQDDEDSTVMARTREEVLAAAAAHAAGLRGLRTPRGGSEARRKSHDSEELSSTALNVPENIAEQVAQMERNIDVDEAEETYRQQVEAVRNSHLRASAAQEHDGSMESTSQSQGRQTSDVDLEVSFAARAMEGRQRELQRKQEQLMEQQRKCAALEQSMKKSALSVQLAEELAHQAQEDLREALLVAEQKEQHYASLKKLQDQRAKSSSPRPATTPESAHSCSRRRTTWCSSRECAGARLGEISASLEEQHCE